MFLPLPTSTITDLAHAHQQKPSPAPSRRWHDPDGFGESDALRPDPVYMALSALLSAGPLGRLRSYFADWRAEREERRYAADSAVAAASRIVRQPQASELTTAARDQIGDDLAA